MLSTYLLLNFLFSTSDFSSYTHRVSPLTRAVSPETCLDSLAPEITGWARNLHPTCVNFAPKIVGRNLRAEELRAQ